MSIALVIVGSMGQNLISPTRAAAANPFMHSLTQFGNIGDPCTTPQASFFTFPAWYSKLPHKITRENPTECDIVITGLSDLWLIVFPVVESLVKIAGYVSVSMIIWGSILFVKSQGDPGKVAAARNTIRDAVIGLVIAASSVAIIQYVATKF